MRLFCKILLALCLLTLQVHAQRSAADEVKRLQARMYKLYAGHDYDLFMSVTDSLKEAAEKAGDERVFYRAWGNQALFSSNRSRRNRGMQIAKAMQEHASAHNSKWGVYTSTHVSAHIYMEMGSTAIARHEFQKAIDYAHEYLPGESAATSLLELAKMEMVAQHKLRSLEYCELAMKEPGLNPLHRLNALSIKCLVLARGLSNRTKEETKADFYKVWQERERVRQAYGRDDIYSRRIEIWKHILDEDYDAAIDEARKFESESGQLEFQRIVYYMKGDYRNAYSLLWKHERMIDSIQAGRNAHLLAEMSSAMDVSRLENEQKELRLRNQSLRLENMASELEQQRLKGEAMDLSLKNKEVELQNASVKQRNDSLEKYNKDLQISEYESKMAAHESAEQTRRVFLTMAAILAALVFAALAFTLWRRVRHEQQLKQINSQLTEANTNLKTAYDKLEETTAAKERIESELRIARSIQMGMVPSTFPPFPERSDIDIFASLESAKEVGGDLYDFFLNDDKLYFCIGDVSGKGIPASLFMSVVINMFRMVAKEGLPPEHIATKLNEAVSENNENGMFCTMFIAEIDLKADMLYFCNAGHNPPVILDRQLSPQSQAALQYMDLEPNAPIGLWPELEFTGQSLSGIKGRPLFLYTDGLSEAENSSQQQFGDDRILEVLASQPFRDARSAVELMKSAIAVHVGDAEQSDDLTMLCINCSA